MEIPNPQGFTSPQTPLTCPSRHPGVPEPSSAAFAWAGRGGGVPGGGVYCNPKWLESRSSCLGGAGPEARGCRVPAGRVGPRALGQVALGRPHLPPHVGQAAPHPAPCRAFPPGSRRSSSTAPTSALTPTRTLAWSGGYLRTPPPPCRDPSAAAVRPPGPFRPPGSSGTLTPAGRPSRERGGGR